MDKQISEKFLKNFGKNIRQLRQKQNLTQMELANKCKVDVKKIGRTERGEYNFKVSSLIEIAKGLDMKISELLNFNYQ